MKTDQNSLLTSLKGRKERVKEQEERVKELEERVKELEERVEELEETNVKVQEDIEEKSKEKSRELLVTQKSKYIETLNKPIQTQSKDTKVSDYILSGY